MGKKIVNGILRFLPLILYFAFLIYSYGHASFDWRGVWILLFGMFFSGVFLHFRPFIGLLFGGATAAYIFYVSLGNTDFGTIEMTIAGILLLYYFCIWMNRRKITSKPDTKS